MANPVGPPLKFKSVKKLQEAIDAYFRECDPHWISEEYWDWPVKNLDDDYDEELEPQGHGGALKRRHRSHDLDYSAPQELKTRMVLTVQVPYTITGLALALDTTRKTLLDYEERASNYQPGDDGYDPLYAKLSNTIKKAKAKVENYAETYLYNGKNTAGGIFNLKNNFGWADKQEIDETSQVTVITRKHEDDVADADD